MTELSDNLFIAESSPRAGKIIHNLAGRAERSLEAPSRGNATPLSGDWKIDVPGTATNASRGLPSVRRMRPD